MLCLAEIVLDGRWFSRFFLSIVLSLGLGFQFRGFFNLLVIFPFDTSTMFGFLFNAVPKACAAIPTMASSFFVRRTFVFLQV